MIQVIHRAIDIVEYVAKDNTQPKLLGNIAKDLNLNAATCANIIKTLVNRGFLKKAVKEKGYLLGNAISEIANGTFGFKDLIAVADVEMEKTLKILNENSLIAFLKENKRIILHKKVCTQAIQVVTPDEKEAYDTSSGRLLVAMLSDKDLMKYLKKYGLPTKNVWPGANSRENFLTQIELIRANGYALIDDSVQVVGIATPIYRNEKVIASLSIYIPSFRFDDKIKQEMMSSAVSLAKKLSVF
jgi:DNA-binding IclR family transcriptional regulator